MRATGHCMSQKNYTLTSQKYTSTNKIISYRTRSLVVQQPAGRYNTIEITCQNLSFILIIFCIFRYFEIF